MSIYRTLKGYSVKSVSSDPSNVKEGQIWYNSTAKVIKVVPTITSWASANALGTARLNAGSTSSGPRDASLYFGGEGNPNNAVQAVNESYDGSSWTELSDLNTARRNVAGFGTQTSAGTLTAGLLFGGENSAGDGHAAETYHYDGTNWTDGGDLNTARSVGGGAGTQTAALMFGGDKPGTADETEEYNGTSWTNANDMNNTTKDMGSGGLQTNAMSAGGEGGPAKNLTELYDGTTWSTAPTLATARHGGGTTTASASTSSILFGGLIPPFSNATEEFTAAATTRTVDVS